MIGLFDSNSVISYYAISWDKMTDSELTSLTEIKFGSVSLGGFAIKESDGAKRLKFLPIENMGRSITLVVYDVYATIVEAWTTTS